ncbi:HisA/HisF-related TIM barrel protein [Candidatus Methylomirabilis sp.]|uniref:HisA/HisF-related TIM barrel protein n=1 Tax=Candidatus Methylomirabilis sp. TaxID=2032687 RepID=UPI003C788D0E
MPFRGPWSGVAVWGVTMQVIPVIDILRGVAVHARRGERMAYRPIQSVLLQGADPVALLRAYRDTFESEAVYVADLDAIMGSGDDLTIIAEMAASEPQLEIIVDAGIRSVEQAKSLLDAGVSKVIVASESLASLDAAVQLLAALGADRALCSIDLKDRAVIWREPSTETRDPCEAATSLMSLGFREAIFLEMNKIGTGGGADTELLDRVTTAAPGMRFIVGGGITSVADLVRLKRVGASGVLLATALHDGTITRQDLIRVKVDD